jgi:hypothetical protein
MLMHQLHNVFIAEVATDEVVEEQHGEQDKEPQRTLRP